MSRASYWHDRWAEAVDRAFRAFPPVKRHALILYLSTGFIVPDVYAALTKTQPTTESRWIAVATTFLLGLLGLAWGAWEMKLIVEERDRDQRAEISQLRTPPRPQLRFTNAGDREVCLYANSGPLIAVLRMAHVQVSNNPAVLGSAASVDNAVATINFYDCTSGQQVNFGRTLYGRWGSQAVAALRYANPQQPVQSIRRETILANAEEYALFVAFRDDSGRAYALDIDSTVHYAGWADPKLLLQSDSYVVRVAIAGTNARKVGWFRLDIERANRRAIRIHRLAEGDTVT